MKTKNKITCCVLSVIACALTGYILWLFLRPVEIVAIHHRSSGFSSVLVKNFPFTDKGKINWWLKNKDMLKAAMIFPNLHPMGDIMLLSGCLVRVIKKKENTTDYALSI